MSLHNNFCLWLSVLNISHRLETNLLTKKSYNILERGEERRQWRTHWIWEQICPWLHTRRGSCLDVWDVILCINTAYTSSTSHDGTSGNEKCGCMQGSWLEPAEPELATPDRILEQTTESEAGPAAATPTDRHDPDWPSLRAWPLPKCLPAPGTFLYLNPLVAIFAGLAVGHSELNLTWFLRCGNCKAESCHMV